MEKNMKNKILLLLILATINQSKADWTNSFSKAIDNLSQKISNGLQATYSNPVATGILGAAAGGFIAWKMTQASWTKECNAKDQEIKRVTIECDAKDEEIKRKAINSAQHISILTSTINIYKERNYNLDANSEEQSNTISELREHLKQKDSDIKELTVSKNKLSDELMARSDSQDDYDKKCIEIMSKFSVFATKFIQEVLPKSPSSPSEYKDLFPTPNECEGFLNKSASGYIRAYRKYYPDSPAASQITLAANHETIAEQ